ncbi:hypothetical protein COOONC_14482 [Cooperia oncophora]
MLWLAFDFRGYHPLPKFHLSTAIRAPSKPNVVNISVRSDTSVLCVKPNNHDNITPLPSLRPSTKQSFAPPPGMFPSTTQSEQPRKSLSAKYIEEKSNSMSQMVREKPQADKTEEQSPAPYHYEAISKTTSPALVSTGLDTQATKLLFPEDSESTSNDTCNGVFLQNGNLDPIYLGEEVRCFMEISYKIFLTSD